MTDDLLAPIALIARAFTPYDLPFDNFTTLTDVRPLPREIHDFPPLIEYWYVVIALSPVFAGALNVSMKPPTSGDNGWALETALDVEWAHAMARKGKEHVREHFLTPRLLRDYLRIFNGLLADRA